MRKSISFLLCFFLLSGLSLNLYSQSEEDKLDQVKLAQQLIGTWEQKFKNKKGEDVVTLWTVSPTVGKGLMQKLETTRNGELTGESISVIGFSDDLKSIYMTWVWSGKGDMTIDIGRFVSEKKLVMERIRQSSPMHAVALIEIDLSTPDEVLFTYKGRGQKITWEQKDGMKRTFTKIK